MPNIKKIDFLYQELQKFNYNDFTIQELADRFNCNEKTVRNCFKEYNLSKKICNRKYLDTLETVKKYISEGYTQSEIAELTNQSVRQITVFCNHSNLKNPNISEQRDLYNTEYQVFLGSMLGDGCLYHKGTSDGSFLCLEHSIKQEEYLKHKIQLCKDMFGDKKLLYRTREPNELIPTFQDMCYIKSKPFKKLEEYRSLWYTPKKIVPEQIWDIEPLGLAIWFMDDGYKGNSTAIFCTNGFSYKDVELLQKVLLYKFNIKSGIWKKGFFINTDIQQYLLGISKKSYHIFKQLVEPHMIESMKYKLI